VEPRPGGSGPARSEERSARVSEPEPDPRREEQALVERMLAGDEAAMEEFADGYFPGLYRFACARLRGDGELARELVQITVCKALAGLAGYRAEAPLFTWLCACCRNEIRMHFRRQGHLPRTVDLDGLDGEGRALLADPEPGGRPDGALARKEEARRVHAALDLLPPRYARALEWKYLERVPVQEIAARLRLGTKAAESLLGRARRAFREGYERVSQGGSLEP
jgi:RNA polymerase sigma-70 factor (ECF subfamily)